MAARWDQTQTLLDVTDATTDQTSVAIKRRPSGSQGVLVSVDVTAAGGGLLLDLTLEAWSEAMEEWVEVATEIPSADGITGVSETNFTLGPLTATDSNLTHLNVQPFVRMRVKVIHGDATTATYAVYAQWF